jgi:hypothetical protein
MRTWPPSWSGRRAGPGPAAQAHLQAGGFGKALELLAAAEGQGSGPLDELQAQQNRKVAAAKAAATRRAHARDRTTEGGSR